MNACVSADEAECACLVTSSPYQCFMFSSSSFENGQPMCFHSFSALKSAFSIYFIVAATILFVSFGSRLSDCFQTKIGVASSTADINHDGYTLLSSESTDSGMELSHRLVRPAAIIYEYSGNEQDTQR